MAKRLKFHKANQKSFELVNKYGMELKRKLGTNCEFVFE